MCTQRSIARRASFATKRVPVSRALGTLGSVCLWAWLALAPSRAAALELSWSAPAACPEQSVVEARLRVLLGERPDPSALRAKAKVLAQRGGYKLTLQLDGDGIRGARVLTGSDCAALAETAAWLVATAIDPALGLLPPPAAPEPPPAAVPPEGPPPPPPPPPPPAPAPSPKPESPWVLHASLHGGLWRVMERPVAQGALGLSVGVSRRWLLAELRADLGVPSESEIGQEGTVKASSEALGLAACGLWGSWLRAGPCVGVHGVRSHARASALLVRDFGVQAAYWAEVRAGAQVAARLAWPVELLVEGGVGAPVTPRPNFTVTGAAETLGTQQLTVYARLGLRFRWPFSPSGRR
jgi:hypothetical protein